MAMERESPGCRQAQNGPGGGSFRSGLLGGINLLTEKLPASLALGYLI